MHITNTNEVRARMCMQNNKRDIVAYKTKQHKKKKITQHI